MDKKVDNGQERKAAETERKDFYEIDLECIKEKQKKTTAGQKTGRKIKNRS